MNFILAGYDHDIIRSARLTTHQLLNSEALDVRPSTEIHPLHAATAINSETLEVRPSTEIHPLHVATANINKE